jgi:hypothetical protein
MAETRRTWIPQFSLRTILIVIAACAVVAFIAGQGQRGVAWAAGLSIGVLGIAVSFGVFAAIFVVARLMATYAENRKIDRGLAERYAWRSNPGDDVAKLLLLAATIGSLFLGGTAWASSGGVVVLPFGTPGTAAAPAGPTPKSSGLTLTIDTTWVDSKGYRPVRVTVVSKTGPVAADRVLTVRFHQKTGFSTRDDVVVTQTIELPLGTTTVTATVSVPQFAASGSFELETFEDGLYVKELSIPAGNSWTSWSGTDQGDGASPVILALTPIDLASIGRNEVGMSPETMTIGDNSNTAALPSGAPTNITSFAGLPTKWIDYTGFDLMIVSVRDLHTLVEQHAEQWKAIRAWQRNGGTIVIFDVGKEWEKLADLEKLLSLPATTSRDSDSEDIPVRFGWTLPLLADFVPLRTTPVPAAPPESSEAAQSGEAETGEKAIEPAPRATGAKAPFVIRKDGLGLFVAIRANALSSGNYPWIWILNSVGPERWGWYQRYGLSFSQQNVDFWNFLIPGVGLAPTLSFQFLITVFVIGIGPVNYWLLKRRGALNMLVLTVPISAAAVTAALVLFAFLSDGLSTRVRVRSITQIDQASGETTCWSRLSYYAGLSPGDGLVFSDDTQVEPLESSPFASNAGPTRDLTWAHADPSDAKSPVLQKLTEGWLQSRTPTQFITARIRQSKLALDIRTTPPDGATVKNRLGSAVKLLVLADENENLFSARELPNGGTAKLESANTATGEVMRDMLHTLLDNTPQPPDAMVNHSFRGYFGLNEYGRSSFRQQSASYQNLPPPTQSTSVLEASIAAVRDQLERKALAPRTYIAIVERGPDVQLGTDAANEEASLHVVTGIW